MLQRLSCNSFWFTPPYSSKMKELNQIILGKGLPISIKGHLCSRKEHSDNPEGQF